MIILAEILIKQGKLDQGEAILKKLMGEETETIDGSIQVEINYLLGEIYFIKWSFMQLGDHNKGLEYHLKSLKLSEMNFSAS